jgi:hypothetical protein
VYQMDMKSTIVNGELEEEVYIEKPEGFQLSENEDYVCILNKALYGLDDIIFESDNDRLSQKISKDMHNEFEMSLLGELSFFLGLHTCQSNQGIFISQTKYIKEMLKRFGIEYCKLVNTPMQTSCKLSKYDDSQSTGHRQYMSMIENLLYVTISRPDVMHAIGHVARFQATPKDHMF